MYIPASHVIKHDADMLSVQLLHDSAEPMVTILKGPSAVFHVTLQAKIALPDFQRYRWQINEFTVSP